MPAISSKQRQKQQDLPLFTFFNLINLVDFVKRTTFAQFFMVLDLR